MLIDYLLSGEIYIDGKVYKAFAWSRRNGARRVFTIGKVGKESRLERCLSRNPEPGDWYRWFWF
jgi:hypothetical protein